MTGAPVLSFVVPVRNDALRLAGCLRSILRNRASCPDLEVIVADNGSTDGSGMVAQELGARVLSLPGVPVAALRNRAAALARGTVLAFVDADHEIAADWVATAIEIVGDPRVGAAGAPYDPPPGATWVQRAYDGLRRHVASAVDTAWLASGNLVIRRRVFDALGGFDAGLEACEDVDLSRRLRAAGYRLVATPRLKSIHHGDPATLRALFFSELWRGRDNLRVSLRGTPALRELVSLAIPIVDLVLLAIAVLGTISLSRPGVIAAGTALTGIAALAALRAGAMSVRLATGTAIGRLQVFAVALVYDAARAIALTTRSSHDRRARS